ncbi:MAG: hypothetical protein K2X93_03995 [Candidatus Obscuribacterales bacterium]|nr:hypothetical protein [Candidatus Obscuribacterales bacterium]
MVETTAKLHYTGAESRFRFDLDLSSPQTCSAIQELADAWSNRARLQLLDSQALNLASSAPASVAGRTGSVATPIGFCAADSFAQSTLSKGYLDG